MINEVLPNGGDGSVDAVELFNATGRPIDIGGWYLSDSSRDLMKYEIPSGTIVPGNGYFVIDGRSFNPTPQNPAVDHFALSGTNGDDVWLVVAGDDGHVSGFIDHVSFGPSRVAESFGRLPNGSGRFFQMRALRLAQ